MIFFLGTSPFIIDPNILIRTPSILYKTGLLGFWQWAELNCLENLFARAIGSNYYLALAFQGMPCHYDPKWKLFGMKYCSKIWFLHTTALEFLCIKKLIKKKIQRFFAGIIKDSKQKILKFHNFFTWFGSFGVTFGTMVSVSSQCCLTLTKSRIPMYL